jgi:hypothetical protein
MCNPFQYWVCEVLRHQCAIHLSAAGLLWSMATRFFHKIRWALLYSIWTHWKTQVHKTTWFGDASSHATAGMSPHGLRACHRPRPGVLATNESHPSNVSSVLDHTSLWKVFGVSVKSRGAWTQSLYSV